MLCDVKDRTICTHARARPLQRAAVPKVHVPKLQSSGGNSGTASEDDNCRWESFSSRMCPEVRPPAMLGPRPIHTCKLVWGGHATSPQLYGDILASTSYR
ncbi:hypothetical protein F2P81_008170 [Scophthalmus maximus]|uniref:Uncharacterized protein n=1 Tax=Scophthalmus maximus TaxID=52904 RepID=A0A6A4T477_SCOMX|nr:hypothetical protein F2P81_008170 [Scophthalmus maximus]